MSEDESVVVPEDQDCDANPKAESNFDECMSDCDEGMKAYFPKFFEPGMNSGTSQSTHGNGSNAGSEGLLINQQYHLEAEVTRPPIDFYDEDLPSQHVGMDLLNDSDEENGFESQKGEQFYCGQQSSNKCPEDAPRKTKRTHVEGNVHLSAAGWDDSRNYSLLDCNVSH